MKHSIVKTKTTGAALVLFALFTLPFSACKKKEKEDVKQPETKYEIKDFKVMDSETGSYDSITNPHPCFVWEITPDAPEGSKGIITIAEMKQGEKEEDALKSRGKDIVIGAEIFKLAGFVRYSSMDYKLQPKTRYAVRFTFVLHSGATFERRTSMHTLEFFKPKAYFKSLYAWGEALPNGMNQMRMMFEWNAANNYDINLVRYKIVKAWVGNPPKQHLVQATVAKADWRWAQVNEAVWSQDATSPTQSTIVKDWSIPTTTNIQDPYAEFNTSFLYNGFSVSPGPGWVYIVALKYNDQEFLNSMYTAGDFSLPFWLTYQ